jgi:hypothetical protein
MKLQTVFVGAVLGLAVFVSGCGSTKEVGPAVNTGFFKDYEAINAASQASLKKYTNIRVAKVQVIPAIGSEKQTASQKKMYQDIAAYLDQEYKKLISASGRYNLVEKDTKNTLVLESAISAVEVHFDDKEWNQLSPIAMGLDVVSFNAYMYEFVRLLGEMKLVDAESGKVVSSHLNILKDEKIFITGDDLELKNVKAGLDSWLAQVKVNLEK